MKMVLARAAVSLGRLASLLPDQAEVERRLAPLLKDPETLPRVAASAALLALRLSPPKL